MYFGFVLKTAVITQGCFCCCWTELTQRQDLFCLLYCPTSVGPQNSLGMCKNLRGDAARTADPKWLTGYSRPYGITFSIYSWGKKKGGGGSEWWGLSSQVAATCDRALLSWEWLNTCLPLRSGKWSLVFLYLLNCLYLNPPVLSYFTLLILSHILHRDGEQMAAWYVIAGWSQSMTSIYPVL